MKRIFLTLIALLPGLIPAENLNAENKTFLPILEIGKEWTFINYQVNGEPHKPNEPYGGKVVGTIEEDGHEVFIFYPLNTDLPTDPDKMSYFIDKAYEEDGVLWFFSYEDEEYVPMIDFNLEVGDKILDYEEVVWKELVVIEGIERCVMAIHTPGSKVMDYWIEGIGAMGDTYLSSLVCHIGERSRIIECRMGHTCLFSYDQMDKYLSEARTLTVKKDADTSLYDMMGRRISSPAPGQLYIRDGKKYIGE